MEITFGNGNGMRFTVTNFGATLISIRVPDRYGDVRDVILGYDTEEEYKGAGEMNFGGTIGRNANRIGNAGFELNGRKYTLADNDSGNNLHSGPDKYNLRVWNVKGVRENGVTFSLHSPDGDQGYPGALDAEVSFTLTDDNALCIDYFAVADADTVINMTNHAYFNLNGDSSGTVLDHELTVDADAFTPTDSRLIPTGDIVPVAGTPMDFRKKKSVGRDITADYGPVMTAGGYDHNWCLNNGGKFAKAAQLSSRESGISMDVYTNLPGMQIYTGNFLNGEKGRNNAVYGKWSGICFETQYYPDAVNHPAFPSPVRKKGEIYRTVTVYKFTCAPDA